MARVCPETGDVVLYTECMECRTRSCRTEQNTANLDHSKELRKGPVNNHKL